MIASIPSGAVQSFLGEGNPYANWATVVLIITLAYYITLSIPLALGMMLFGALCLFGARIVGAQGYPLWAVSLGDFCGGVDWTILRTQSGREEAIIFQGPAVLADRSRVADALRLQKNGNTILV